MENATKSITSLINAFQKDCIDVILPPEAGLNALGQNVISLSLVKNTRGYIEKVAYQVNGCYDNGWYDACAVMLRRLLETLIIESFEAHGISAKIQDTNKEFYFLSDLISLMLTESAWNLSRNSKKSLPKLKDIGDKSAHSRRFHALRSDIDRILPDIRLVTQELIYIAKLK